MGNQVDQKDLYQESSLVRGRRFGQAYLTYIVKPNSIVRTRAFGTHTVSYKLNPTSIVRTRKFGATEVVWTSGVYTTETPSDAILAARDFGDKTKRVFEVSPAGDIIAKSITVTQKVSGTPALTIKRAVSGAQLVLVAEDEVGEIGVQLWEFPGGPFFNLLASPTFADAGAAFALSSPLGVDVVSLHNEVTTDDPNHAGYIAFSDDNADGTLKLKIEYPSRLILTDVGLSAEDKQYIGWPRIQEKFKTADESINNSTTFQNDDHLQFDIKINETWFVEIMAMVQPNTATMDFKHQLGGVTGLTYLGGAQGSFAAPPTALTSATYTVDMPGTSVYPVFWRGWVTADATHPGTVHWQWAQSVLENSTPGVTVKKNSWLRAKRISPAT